MKKIIIKSALYIILILISLEFIVRVFHLNKDNPSRFVDEYKVEKWIPNQEGYSVTGNRRQNFSKFYINSFGYNSYREFTPSKDKIELALVGDSFIEGFHQNYYNSIGKKIEDKLVDTEVYEYGYAGYDLADQLHLIYAYKETFDLIDHVVLGLKFKNDLNRGEYHVVQDRMHLESPLYKKARRIKLLVYAQNIGVLAPLWKLAGRLASIGKKKKPYVHQKKETKQDLEIKHATYIKNFQNLIDIYGFDKERFMLLIDKGITPQVFLNYLDDNNFKYIDFSQSFNESKKPTTLIYDRHWNNHGRNLVAGVIYNYIKDEKTKTD
ncbi:hypothetical protein A8C32_03590 [Flavivirga aquatica]|uniref:SGNH hydrolase-type esterase domain-containing protein n=1 Tax=Flavivirga aquatica TaxID=1849968 RepID=A0A1E5TB49_9FLAO|nr:hypothetical protein [Flavivirga aquatica]OEK08547.1 hypothetical protein A8C32_03590 [Flavivirga aquatica]